MVEENLVRVIVGSRRLQRSAAEQGLEKLKKEEKEERPKPRQRQLVRRMLNHCFQDTRWTKHSEFREQFLDQNAGKLALIVRPQIYRTQTEWSGSS